MIEEFIRQYLAGVTAQTILDVGPGYSNFSRISAKVAGAKKISFLDNDENVLAWQANECKRLGIEAEYLNISLDVADLSAVQGKFNIIHMQEVLEHLPNAQEVLSAIAKLLTDDGRMIITVPTKRSERWLKSLNPAYMKDEPYGHVNEFDELLLRNMLRNSDLSPDTFFPTQPHYFISHTWLVGTRIRIKESSGRILTTGWRVKVFEFLNTYLRKFFKMTGASFWGRVFPRNYFIVARKATRAHSA